MLTTALWGRSAMVLRRCPGHIKDSRGIRSQISRVINSIPAIDKAAVITLPKMMDGVEQKLLGL